MKFLLTAIAISAVALTPGLVPVAQAAVAPAGLAQPGTRYEKALAFVKVLNSEARVESQIRDGYYKGFRESIAHDPQAQAVEAQFPGFFEEVADATLPYVNKLVLAGLPDLWRLQATYLADHMTDGELDDCIAFFTSPVGLRMVDALAGAFVGENVMAEAQGDAPRMSAEGMTRDIAAATPAALASLSAADKSALLAFSRTPGGIKLQQINPGMIEIMTKWSNDVLLSNNGLQEEVMRQAQAIMTRRTQGKAK